MLQIQVQAKRTPAVQSTASIVSLVTQEDPEDVPVIQGIQKVVELPLVLFMDEVVGMPIVMKGRCAEHLEVATDPVPRQDLWCSRGDARPGPHRSSEQSD